MSIKNKLLVLLLGYMLLGSTMSWAMEKQQNWSKQQKEETEESQEKMGFDDDSGVSEQFYDDSDQSGKVKGNVDEPRGRDRENKELEPTLEEQEARQNEQKKQQQQQSRTLTDKEHCEQNPQLNYSYCEKVARTPGGLASMKGVLESKCKANAQSNPRACELAKKARKESNIQKLEQSSKRGSVNTKRSDGQSQAVDIKVRPGTKLYEKKYPTTP